MKKDFWKKLITSLLAAALLLPAGLAFAEEDGVQEVTVNFTTSAKIDYSIDFPYSDSFFRGDDSEYSHDLAKASMGLTVAAFRVGTVTDAGNYFEKTGFEGIDTTAYETLPTAETIADCIAHKKIDNFTLIAVGVCGGDYGREWASNFKIGDSERAEGFNEAAQKVISRIKDYIDEYKLEGELRLWVTGMSRAGAVANITAADMTDSGLFTQVYGYTFGTPRTTRNPGEYGNIFNIMSKDDIVPKVPLADWGYKHFGKDLYLPSQECDSNWPSRAVKAAHALDDGNFRNNPELYDQFRAVFTYIFEFFPTSADYEKGLQDSLIDIINMSEGDDVITILQKAAHKLQPKTEEQRRELDSFISYLDMMSSRYILHGNVAQKENGSWLTGQSIGANLMIEHTVTTYIPWLLATDSAEELYSDNDEFIHLMLDTGSAVTVIGLQGIVQSIDRDGSVTYEGRDYDDVYLACSRTGSQVFVDLPLDAPYSVLISPSADETAVVMATKYGLDSVVPEVLRAEAYEVSAGQPLMIYSAGGEKGLHIEHSSSVPVRSLNTNLEIPMSTITQIENINIFNLSLATLLKICIAVAAVLVFELLVAIVMAIVRRAAGKDKNEKGRAALFINNIAFLCLGEIAVWYFAPAVGPLNEIAAIITFAFVIVYASRSRRWLPMLLLVALMTVSLIFGYGYIQEITPGGAVSVVIRDALFAAAAIIMRRNPKAEKEELS